MGKIKELILKELGDLESVPRENFNMFAGTLEAKLYEFFKPNMPTVNTSKDRWIIRGSKEVVVQGSKEVYLLQGAELEFFVKLYTAYGRSGGKLEAAGAYVATILRKEFKGLSTQEMNESASFILRAAVKDRQNREPDLPNSKVKMLQGWITGMRWED